MSESFLLLRPVTPVFDGTGLVETPWLHGESFSISEPDWVEYLALIATDFDYAGLVEELRALLPAIEMTAHAAEDLNVGLVTGLEDWLTDIHLLSEIFAVDLPAAEDYISYFALQQMLKSLLHVLRVIRRGSLDFEAGLSL